MSKQPMQPVEIAADGIVRFKENAIVNYLYHQSQLNGVGMNELIRMPFRVEDWNQFAQLIGYSVSGFGDLSYADPAIVEAADAEAEKLTRKDTPWPNP